MRAPFFDNFEVPQSLRPFNFLRSQHRSAACASFARSGGHRVVPQSPRGSPTPSTQFPAISPGQPPSIGRDQREPAQLYRMDGNPEQRPTPGRLFAGETACYQCLLLATWTDSDTALQLEVGPSHETFNGWFFTATGARHEVSLSTSWHHDVFSSGDSSDTLNIAGTVKTAQASVTVNRKVYSGQDTTGPFLFATSLTTIARGAVTAVLDTYRGTFMKSGQTLPHLVWAGTVTLNGGAVGGLQWKVLSSSASSKVVQMLLAVGSDRLDLGSVTIDPTADVAWDSQHSGN